MTKLSWKQQWANFYTHLTRDMNQEETAKALQADYNAIETEMEQLQGRLEGFEVFYTQRGWKKPDFVGSFPDPPTEEEIEAANPRPTNLYPGDEGYVPPKKVVHNL